MKYEILGVKRFSGLIDGKHVNSGKLFVRLPFDTSKNSDTQFVKGFATDFMRVTPDIVRSIEHNTFPLLAEVETTRMMSGSKAVDVVTSVKPISQKS